MEQLVTALLSCVAGTIVPKVLEGCGALVGPKAVDYYAEVHLSKMNCIVHTLFMPTTTLGTLLWFPYLFGGSPRFRRRLRWFLYGSFMTHYMHVDPWVGILTKLLYFGVVREAVAMDTDNWRRDMYVGLRMMVGSLLVQEVGGHWLGGDQPSRLEGIPNAIGYAIYFSVSHWFM